MDIKNKDNFIYALSLAIEAKFEEGDWIKLAYEIEEIDTIKGHRRLLRSLKWRDPDYPTNILNVLERIGKNPEKLICIAELIGLENWLLTNREDLYQKLYADSQESSYLLDQNPLDTEQFSLTKQIGRIYSSIPL